MLGLKFLKIDQQRFFQNMYNLVDLKIFKDFKVPKYEIRLKLIKDINDK